MVEGATNIAYSAGITRNGFTLLNVVAVHIIIAGKTARSQSARQRYAMENRV